MGALHRAFGLDEMVVGSYQAASGAGPGRHRHAVRADGQGRRTPDARPARRVTYAAWSSDLGPFPAPLALNVVPWAGSLKDDGWSSEELKIRNESRKILGLPDLRVSATCVRVPVVTTHSVAVHAVFEPRGRAGRTPSGYCATRRASARRRPGAAASSRRRPTSSAPTRPGSAGCAGRLDDPRALDLFVCGDNLRKGAALNTAQIAELVAAEL